MCCKDEASTPLPPKALDRLLQGNRRFMADALRTADTSASRRASLVNAQNPFAAVLTCSDSRVPPEILFDQGLGDLFVVRVAGNVVDDVVLGSLEYAVTHLHVPLLMVLGHEGCGAVTAACAGPRRVGDGAVSCVLDALSPAIARATAHCRTQGSCDPPSVDAVVLENIALGLEMVLANPVFAETVGSGALLVVGAKYQLLSGLVSITQATA